MPERPYPMEPWIEAYKKDVDRTLLRENLKLTHEERLRKLEDMQRFIYWAHQSLKERRKKRGSADTSAAG